MSGDSSHGSLKSYIIGLVLSLILTAIAFGFVMQANELNGVVLTVITVTAVAQVLVQLVFFLHLTGKKEQSWESTTGLYVLLSLLILLVLSMWIFHHFRINTLMVGH